MNIEPKVNYQNNINSVITLQDAERLFGWFNLVVSNDIVTDKTFLGGLTTFIRDNNIAIIKNIPATFRESEVRLLVLEETNVSTNLFRLETNDGFTPLPAYLENNPIVAGDIIPNKVYTVNYVSDDGVVYITNLSRTVGDDTDYTFWDSIIPWGDLQKGVIHKTSLVVSYDYLHISNGGSFRSIHYITSNTSVDSMFIVMNEEGKYTIFANDNINFLVDRVSGDLNELYLKFNEEVLCRSIQFERDENITMSLSVESVGSNNTPIQMLKNNLVGRRMPDGSTIELISNSTTSPASVYNRVMKVGTGLKTDFSYGVEYGENTITIEGIGGSTRFVGIDIDTYNNDTSLGPIESKYLGMASVDLNTKRKDTSDDYADSLGITPNATDETAVTYKDTVINYLGFIGLDDSLFNEINTEKSEDDMEVGPIMSGLILNQNDGSTLGCYLASFKTVAGNHVTDKVSRFTDKYRSTLNLYDYDISPSDCVFSGDKTTDEYKIYGISMGCNIREIPTQIGTTNNDSIRTGYMFGSTTTYNLGKTYMETGFTMETPPYDEHMSICYTTNGLLYTTKVGSDYNVIQVIGNASGTVLTVSGDAIHIMIDEDYIMGTLTLIALTRIGTSVFKYIVTLSTTNIQLQNISPEAVYVYATNMFFPLKGGDICWVTGTSNDVVIEYVDGSQAVVRCNNMVRHVEKGSGSKLLIVDNYDYIWECATNNLVNEGKFKGRLIRANPDLNGYNPILNYTGLRTDVLNRYNVGHRIDLKSSFTSFVTGDTSFARTNIRHN